MWQTTFRAVAYGLSLCTLVVSGLACGSPKSKRANGDSDDLGDGGMKPTKLDVLPGGYEARIACGDLGKSCSNDDQCKDPLVCNGGLCLPDSKNTGSCSEGCPASHPICVNPTCVSADQLGCICLDEGGRAGLGLCDAVSEEPDNQCLGTHALCDPRPTGCCEGLTCITGKDDMGRKLLGLCEQKCADHGECDDDECCLESAAVAEKFCAPRSACMGRCRTQKEECDGDLFECCEGLVCVSSDKDPDLSGCQPACEKHTECSTGCCVLFTAADGSQLDHGICAPSDRCATP